MNSSVMAAQAATHDKRPLGLTIERTPCNDRCQRALMVVVGGRLRGHDECGHDDLLRLAIGAIMVRSVLRWVDFQCNML
jgi:hypothetical protein